MRWGAMMQDFAARPANACAISLLATKSFVYLISAFTDARFRGNTYGRAGITIDDADKYRCERGK